MYILYIFPKSEKDGSEGIRDSQWKSRMEGISNIS